MRRASKLLAVVGLLGLAACMHTPTKPGARADLSKDARETLRKMETEDPGLKSLIDQSAGVIVFPAVGEGGFLVGGGAGAGVVFEKGKQTGFAELRHLSAGALLGGQRYAQLVVVRDPAALQQMRQGRFDFGAKASAVIVRAGAAAQATFDKGVAVFRQPIRGAMVNASVAGERIRLTL